MNVRIGIRNDRSPSIVRPRPSGRPSCRIGGWSVPRSVTITTIAIQLVRPNNTIAAIAAIVLFGRTNWIAMVVIVTLLGTDHPPIRHDGRPLGLGRTMLGLLSFLIPILTFMPEPLLFD